MRNAGLSWRAFAITARGEQVALHLEGLARRDRRLPAFPRGLLPTPPRIRQKRPNGCKEAADNEPTG
jgi:hypothetical protein